MGDNKEGNARRIINEILAQIREGRLISGQVLPSQNELCKIFKTGRGSVREALQALELVGVVEIRPGKGVFVSKFTFNLILNPARLIYKPDIHILPDLLEFRELFETIVVRASIKNATDEDFYRIQENLELTKLYCDRKDIEQFTKMDYTFHRRLTESTHNKVIETNFEIIYPLLKYSIEETTKIPGVMAGTYREHEKIFNYIKSKDIKNAVSSMIKHMRFVKKYVDRMVKQENR